MKNIIRIFVGI